MTRSISFFKSAHLGIFNLAALLFLAMAGTFGVTSAQAQVVGGCVGSCAPPAPSFTAAVWGGGTTGAINVANFGAGGTGNSGSSVQDFLNINVTLTASGNPSGFCGEGCAGNNVSMNLNGQVMAQGFAMHELTGQGGQAGGTTSNSASNVQFNGAAGGVWQPTGGMVIPTEYRAIVQPAQKK